MTLFQLRITDEGFIETTLKDGISARELKLGITEAHQLAVDREIERFLVDASSATSNIPLVTYYQLPDFYSSLNISRSSRIAVLSSRSQRGRKRARFFVNVCINRGWQARLFYDRSEAVNWLVEG